MKAVYPVMITKEKSNYIAYIPDFHIRINNGRDIAETIELARKAIVLVGSGRNGDSSPTSFVMDEIQNKNLNDFVTLVDIDFDKYQNKSLDSNNIKKVCKIPTWLNEEAEKAGINFSALLQVALYKQLQQINEE